jgi:spermidine synthase
MRSSTTGLKIVRLSSFSESGIGLPHSTTSRKELRPRNRASVLECGSPMPLSRPFVTRPHLGLLALCILTFATTALAQRSSRSTGTLVYEVTSPYHHIRVVDEAGVRTLLFDAGMETRMSLKNGLEGHFEYIDYFHMPWLWNTQITNVLMIGLGGGSAQRAFQYYYPDVAFRTVEIDPTVVRVAEEYFNVRESENHKIEVSDGRVFLRRSTTRYDVILLDAYFGDRYGSSIPQHLATREFFELARDHLTTNGVVAYNVIGTLYGWHADIIGAIYKTLQAVFPQVYVFPATTSMNIVIVATRSPIKTNIQGVRWRAGQLVDSKRITLPGFRQRAESFQITPPASAFSSPILTDDFAPVEGLSGESGNPDRRRQR